jgi:type II secretion system protein H
MDPARSGASRQRGFTLIELMIVLVIFGMLVGMGIPSYQKYSRTQRLRGTSENLVQTIQLQRSRAMATGQNVRINFNTAAPAGWTCMADGQVHSNHTNLPNGVTYLSAVPDFLILSRDGRANTSGTIVFTNTTGNSDTVSVQLSGLALIR